MIINFLLLILTFFGNQIFSASLSINKEQIERRIRNIVLVAFDNVHKTQVDKICKANSTEGDTDPIHYTLTTIPPEFWNNKELWANYEASLLKGDIHATLPYSSVPKPNNFGDNYRTNKLRELRERNRIDAQFDLDIYCLPPYQDKIAIALRSIQTKYTHVENLKAANKLLKEVKQKFSANDWKSYFEQELINKNIYLTNEAARDLYFGNYVLYQFPGYIEFLKGFDSYDQRIVRLQHNIQTNNQFKERLANIKNFNFKVIEDECTRIQLRELAKQAKKNESDWLSDSEQQKFSNTRDKLIDKWSKQLSTGNSDNILLQRIEAARKDGSYTQSYYLDPTVERAFQKCGVNTGNLSSYHATALEHQFVNEAITLATQATEFNDKLQDKYSETTMYLMGQVIEVRGKDVLELQSQMLDVAHSFVGLLKGAWNAGGENIQAVKFILQHPIEAAQNFGSQIGQLFTKAVAEVVDFFVHPKNDEQYQKEFDEFCNRLYCKYKEIPKEKIAEKIGYHISDFIIKDVFGAQAVTAAGSMKKALKCLRKTEVGKQAFNILGQLKDKSFQNLRNATAVILEENGLFNAAELANLNSDTFIPALYKAAEQKAQVKLYQNALANNFKRYNKDVKFKQQYDALKAHSVPIQVIPKGEKLEFVKLPNGDAVIADKFGNIHTLPQGSSRHATTRLSETGKQIFNTEKEVIPLDQITHTYNPAKFADEKLTDAKIAVVGNFCPITKAAADKVAKYYGLELEQATNRKGWVIEMPYNKKGSIKIRIMEAGSGGRDNPYFRVSHPSNGSVDVYYKFNNERALTHIDLTEDYLEQIKLMVEKCKEVKK